MAFLYFFCFTKTLAKVSVINSSVLNSSFVTISMVWFSPTGRILGSASINRSMMFNLSFNGKSFSNSLSTEFWFCFSSVNWTQSIKLSFRFSLAGVDFFELFFVLLFSFFESATLIFVFGLAVFFLEGLSFTAGKFLDFISEDWEVWIGGLSSSTRFFTFFWSSNLDSIFFFKITD